MTTKNLDALRHLSAEIDAEIERLKEKLCEQEARFAEVMREMRGARERSNR